MSSTAQAMLNQSLFEDQDMSSHLGFFSFPPNMTSLPFGCNQSLKTLTTISPSVVPADAQPPLIDSPTLNPKEDIPSHFGGSQLLSLQRSSANIWAWEGVNDCMGSSKRSGGDDFLGVSAIKMKKIKARKKVREPRFCFKTMSDVDVLDDGYKWRKYGQKVVKNTQHPRVVNMVHVLGLSQLRNKLLSSAQCLSGLQGVPNLTLTQIRSYYRCTQDNCRVKKRVERLAEDPRMVITTYEGRHVHSPSHDEDDQQNSSQLNNFFW